MKRFLFIIAWLCLLGTCAYAQGYAPNKFASSTLNLLGCGARGDNVTDDYVAIQACLTAACTSVASDPTGLTGLSVFVPDAPNLYYRHSKPIVLPCSNVTLYGTGNGSAIEPLNYTGGPELVVRSALYPQMSTVLGPALLPMPDSSPSNSFTLSEPGNSTNDYLNLMDINGMYGQPVLSGASAFTIEASYSSNDPAFFGKTDFAVQTITDVNGVYEFGFVGSHPLHFYLSPQGTPGIKVCAAGTLGAYSYKSWASIGATFTLCGGNVTQGVTHHLAVSFDGTTVRVFLDGIVVASGFTSGTMFIPGNTQITIGNSIGGWPDGPIQNTEWGGSLDNIRISTVARYVANFTPPAVKFVNDVSTYALLTFSNNVDIFTQAQAGRTSNGWLFLRATSGDYAGSGQVSIHDIQLGENGSGITSIYVPRTDIQRVAISYPEQWGLYFFGTAYEQHIFDVRVIGPTIAGMIFGSGGAATIETLDHIRIDGGVFPLVINASTTCITCVIQIEGNTVVPISIQANAGNNKIVFLNPEVEGENSSTSFLDSVYLAGAPNLQSSVQFLGGTIEFASGHPFFDRGTKLTLDGTYFHNLGAGSVAMVTTDAMRVTPGSIRLIDLTSDTVEPWIDNPQLAQGSQMGYGQLASIPFANLIVPAVATPYEVYCPDCKNVADDGVAFDSSAVAQGHGTKVLYENGQWRVH